MFQPRHPLQPAVPDLVTPLMELELPRGAQHVHIRLTAFADGCPALEMQDADGRPFYWPTMAACRQTMAELLPPELCDALVVAVKPSTLSNGMAHALTEGGVLIDLGIEMPSDRHFVRLMQVNEPLFQTREQAAARAARREQVAMQLVPPAVPLRWKPHADRITAAFARRGMQLSAADAMLAWAAASGLFTREPPRLPASGDEIVAQLKAHLAPAQSA